MSTLVLPPRYTGDAQRIWRAATGRGWKVMRAMGWKVEPLAGDVCIYGEPLFVRAVADQLGVRLVEPPLGWLAKLPEDLVRREIVFGTLQGALDGPFPRFVKPADDKAFGARVYASAADLAEVPAERDTPTLVSEAVRFEAEFRSFTLGTDVVTHSIYSRFGDLIEEAEPEELAEAHEFTSEVLASYAPCPACVVDVGRLTDGTWAVVEANPCWGSGLYGCDSDAVLDVLAAASSRGPVPGR